MALVFQLHGCMQVCFSAIMDRSDAITTLIRILGVLKRLSKHQLRDMSFAVLISSLELAVTITSAKRLTRRHAWQAMLTGVTLPLSQDKLPL